MVCVCVFNGFSKNGNASFVQTRTDENRQTNTHTRAWNEPNEKRTSFFVTFKCMSWENGNKSNKQDHVGGETHHLHYRFDLIHQNLCFFPIIVVITVKFIQQKAQHTKKTGKLIRQNKCEHHSHTRKLDKFEKSKKQPMKLYTWNPILDSFLSLRPIQ